MATNFLTAGNERGYHFTVHARLRMAQWNLRESDVYHALNYGQQLRRHGIVFYFLRAKDVAGERDSRLARLEGTTVLTDPDSRTVITVYRNRRALHKIKCKVRFNNGEQHSAHSAYVEEV